MKKSNGYWNNKENCANEAKKFKNLKDFRKNSIGAYKVAKKYNWLEAIN